MPNGKIKVTPDGERLSGPMRVDAFIKVGVAAFPEMFEVVQVRDGEHRLNLAGYEVVPLPTKVGGRHMIMWAVMPTGRKEIRIAAPEKSTVIQIALDTLEPIE